jgi:hypothetical protein
MTRASQLKAGVARANITPPVGIQLCGFAGRGPSVGFGDNLYATALVLADGAARAAIVACDLIDLPLPFAETVFAEAARRTRIPADNIVLCCSHTHYGPETRTFEGDATKSDLVAYMADLKFRLAGAIQEANSNLHPVLARVGRGTSDVGINRRERRPDGTIILGRNPGGPIDREVIVLRLDRRNGDPLACVLNFQAHAVSQTHRGRLISADFPGPARDAVEQLTGATCMYIQGACGNINSEIMEVGLQSPRKLGRRLAASAVAAYEKGEPVEVTPVRTANADIKLPAKTYESVKQAREAVEGFEKQLADAQARKAHKGTLHWINLRLKRARAALESLESGKPLPPVTGRMWAIRAGDFALATSPGEIFCEIGQAIKAGSPMPHTMFASCTNGGVGYVPMPENYPEGGYEVDSACRVGPAAAGIVTDTGLRLLKRTKPSR